MSAWMPTSVGTVFDYDQPHVEPGHLFTVIAPSLARIPRFLGHTVEPYSVAQHSVICAEAAESETGDLELAAFCLLHDAHEAYVGDITSPVVDAIASRMSAHLDPQTAELVKASRVEHFRRSLHALKTDIDRVVFRAAGLSLESSMRHRAAIRQIDIRALRTERDDLMLDSPRLWSAGVEEASRLPVSTGRIVALPADQAMAAFSRALQRLCPVTADAFGTGW